MTRMAEKQSGQLHSAVTGGTEKPDMVNYPHVCGPWHEILSLLLLHSWIVHPEGAQEIAWVCRAAITNGLDFTL